MLLVKNSRVAVIAAAMIAVALSGCGEQKSSAGAAKAPPTEVEVQTIALDTAIVHTDLSGRTSAYQIAEVRPQVSGIIQKRLFDEGKLVKAGEQLYQIDPAIYEANVRSAQAAVAQAKASLSLKKANAARSAQLVKANAVSKQSDDTAQAEYRAAQADLQAAEAQLVTARVNLQYTRVNSPISGRVSLSEVTPGALVTANQTAKLTSVTQLDPIYVDVTQSYDTLSRLRAELASGKLTALADGSAKVQLILDDGTVYDQEGKLTFKDMIVEPTTGMVRLRAQFANPKGELLPGMYVRARLEEGAQHEVAKVDQRAVMHDQRGDAYVYALTADNKVEIRYVTAAFTEGSTWVVEKGLKDGDRVIVEGLTKTRPGAVVKPVAMKPAALGRTDQAK